MGICPTNTAPVELTVELTVEWKTFLSSITFKRIYVDSPGLAEFLKQRKNMKTVNQIAILSACCISCSVIAQTTNDTRAAQKVINSKPKSASTLAGSIRAGGGYWAGNTTYSIGGHAWTPQDGSVQLPDKISELKFPLNVAYGSVEGNLLMNNRFELFGSFMGNLGDPSSKMKDSDWGVFNDSGTLDIYSESDAALSAITLEAGGRYWFHTAIITNRPTWSFGAGPGLLYQSLDWKISNVDQWYPSKPQLAHDTQSGEVATYNANIVMPYLNACASLKFKRLTGRAEIAAGPVFVHDEDDHIIREKRAKADMVGVGAKGKAEIRYDLTRHLFALAQLNVLSIAATGTSKQEGYGGDLPDYYAEIDEKFSLTSVNGGLAVGYGF